MLKHPIQKHIVGMLVHKDVARFSEIRPSGVDTNVLSYHLKLLIHDDFIVKHGTAYALGDNGLAYVDRLDDKPATIRQPKVLAMFLIQNSDGEVLLQKREKQPYINSWTLPYGKVHEDDASIHAAAERNALEKLGLRMPDVRHVGDCYIRVRSGDTLLSSTFVHIFRYEIDETFSSELLMWMDPLKLGGYSLAPAVEQIIARSFFGDEHFFAELEHERSATRQ